MQPFLRSERLNQWRLQKGKSSKAARPKRSWGMGKVQPGADVFLILMGAALVFPMHERFAFLEVSTVRRKNQVNVLCKTPADFAISTVAYFFIGYAAANGVTFFMSAKDISGAATFDGNGQSLIKFFFLCRFAAANPAIISGGIAEHARF